MPSRKQLLLDGYIRGQSKVYKLDIPNVIQKVIFDYHCFAQLLKFNEFVDPEMNKAFDFKSNRTKAICKGGHSFVYVLADLVDGGGCTNGIHVFRYKIVNRKKQDMLWGISPYNEKLKMPSYDNKKVYGFQVYGKKCAGGRDTKVDDYNYMNVYDKLVLDVKVDCNANKVSFVGVKYNDSITVDAPEIVINDLPSDITNTQGWVPHFEGYYQGTGTSICEIDSHMFGKYDSSIDEMCP